MLNTRQVIIVSGRSGSGKTTALNVLEDLGYYCIDNLPLGLVPEISKKLLVDSQLDSKKLALGVDIRSPQADLSHFQQVLQELKNSTFIDNVEVLYLTAHEEVLVARFGSNRRRHPLFDTCPSLQEALLQERKLLHPIASEATIKIDTSQLNIHELKAKIQQRLGLNNKVTVSMLSFGFKHGIPIDADFVFDVRFLPNPHWEQNLRMLTGKDAEVQAFFRKYEVVSEMQQQLTKFFLNWLPEMANNNRHSVTIAIGCTGGQHRSVYLVEQIGKLLIEGLSDVFQVVITHREKENW